MTLVRTLSVTRVQTAVYVSAKLVGAMGVILSELGLGTAYRSYDQWALIERSLRTWMEERTLERVTLEVYDPARDDALAVTGFPISYFDPNTDERTFQQDLAIARYQSAKARAAIRANATFRVMVETTPGATTIAGWGPTTARSTSGMVRLLGGTVASGPHASAALEMWIRR